jgi:hypothetical protein
MNDQIAQKIKSLYASNKLPWIIIGVGIGLRLFRYLYNPSLWFDESNMAIDIISRPLSELINPSPDYNQAYPLAFLILIKLSTQVLGTSEHVIRLIPLIAGITALFLFYKVAKSYIEPKAVLIALGLFAVSDSLIFQSSNLKPYSSDVLFTLIIFTVTIYVQSKKLNIPRVILFGISGAIAIWFSNPSVFVLAGVGASLGVFSLINKDWKGIGKLLISYSMWILSFIANYFLYIRNLQANFTLDMDSMIALQNGYMPLPPTSIADIKWFIELFFDIFNNPLTMTLTGIAALSFLAGCVSFYTQKKKIFIILIAPIVTTFLAAALHEYPFKGRFIFFLVPLLLLILTEGAEFIRSRSYHSSRIIGIIFISLLLFHPLSLSAYRIIKPFYWEDIKPVLKYVQDNWQKGDMLYVHYYAQYPFDYYSNYYPEPYRFNEGEYIIGIAPRGWYRNYRKQDVSKYYDPGAPIEQSSIDIFNLYARELDQLKGKKRVWLLFTAAIPKDGIDEEKFLVYHLETIGEQLDFIGHSGISAVYLYDLSDDITTTNE